MNPDLRRRLALLVAGLVVAACGGVSPASPSADPGFLPKPTPPVVDRPIERSFCWPFLMDQFGHARPGEMADEVMAGTITIEPFAPFALPADPTWDEAPYEAHRTWRFNYHSLRWILPLLIVGSGTGDDAVLNEAERLLRDWVESNPRDASPDEMAWDDHAAAWRALVFACAIEPIGAPTWLIGAMEQHAEALMDVDFRAVAGNLALNQDAGLLVMGCILERPTWIEAALTALVPHVTDSVDESGVANEQSVQYHRYNLLNYRRVLAYLDWCERELPEVEARVERMNEFLAYAADPLGRLLQIGDSIKVPVESIGDPLTRYTAYSGQQGTPPPLRLKTYDAGYAFLRSGWGSERSYGAETLMAFRFGPARILHGHADHGAPILISHGSRLLIDPGSKTLIEGEARNWVMSREAHNLVTIDGRSWVASAPAPMTTRCNDERRFVGEIVGDGYGGATVSRTIVFDADERIALLVDSVSQTTGTTAITARSHFHAEAGAQISVDGTRATITPATGPGRLLLLELLPDAEASVVSGQESPRQGWVVDEAELVPAPTLALVRREVQPRWMTLLVPYAVRPPRIEILGVSSGTRWSVEMLIDGRPLRLAYRAPCGA